ncbi:hypothetical protein CPB83DRAFT_766947 [Crepidotus variabilis]|uniref:C3H1-type domain-containing protein n=1 Tax=Crepidotus variabilis TaxID=179855 RepID=A0A9P6EF65_9AGAR|nr:hypothetical protein CPB83DRAFT_766947 [Crepidotus variabilis]
MSNGTLQQPITQFFQRSASQPAQSEGPEQTRSETFAATANGGQSSTDENGTRRRELDQIIEDFRCERSSRIDATQRVLELINSNPPLSDEAKETTFTSILAEISAIRSSKTHVPSGHRETVTPRTNIPRHNHEQMANGERATFDREVDELIDGIAKRPGDDDTADKQIPKRRRLEQSDMPWFESTFEGGTNDARRSCIQTCELLDKFNEDTKRCSFLARTSGKNPTGVPSTEWDKILRGEPLNLDHFLSSIHRVTVDEGRSTNVGDARITFGASEPKRKVSSASDWSTAWRAASRAIAKAFPHRVEELTRYGQHVESYFDAKQVTAHKHVLLYDIAVRNRVGSGTSYLLTDFIDFHDIYTATIPSDGVQHHSSTSAHGGSPNKKLPNGKPKTKKSDVCRKFNSEGGCAYQGCKYLHICKLCGEDGHPDHKCWQHEK